MSKLDLKHAFWKNFLFLGYLIVFFNLVASLYMINCISMPKFAC